MALVLANRVQETTTTTGTGTITLAGAVSGFQSFAAIGNGNTTYYTITSGTNWEVGIGTYTSSGTTLARTTILSSSASGAAITLAGTSTVFADYPANRAVAYNEVNSLTVNGTAVSAPSWTTNGIGIKQAATTYTDTSTPAGDSITTAYMNLFDTATYDSSLAIPIANEIQVVNLYGNYFKNPAYTTKINNISLYAVGTDSLYVNGTSKFNGSIGSITASLVTCNNITANSVGATSTFAGPTTITAGSGLVLTAAANAFTLITTGTGAITIGNTSGTGILTFGRSTGAQTVNIASGVTASGSTKTLNLGANGAAGSTTNITVGGTAGTSTTTMNGNTTTPAGSTGMTSGFFYIPAAAGAPSGVPTAITGTVPMYYDTTNNRFYIYNGAWKLVALV